MKKISSSSATPTTPPPNEEKSPEKKIREIDFTEKKKLSPAAKKKLFKTKTIRKDFSVDEYPDDFDDDDDQEPRPVPQPRPRVTIKKASNGSEKGPILEKTKKQQQQPSKSRPKSAPAVKKSEQAIPPPTVDLRSYSKSLKLLGKKNAFKK